MGPILTDGTEKRWAVFVGGAEVNDFTMNFNDAASLGEDYLEDGYDDIYLYQYDTGEEIRLS